MKSYYEITESQQGKRIDIFNENWYKINENTYYPSVTYINNAVHEEELIEYYKALPRSIINLKFKMAVKDGRIFHNCIENLERYGRISFDDIPLTDPGRMRIWTRIGNYMNFREKHLQDHTVVSIEETVINHEYKYAGTCDLITEKDREKYIWDWKTGDNFWNGNKLQISAYAKALNIHHANVVMFPLHPKPKQGYSVHKLDDELLNIKFKEFLNRKAVFEDTNKKPKFLSVPYEYKINLENYK